MNNKIIVSEFPEKVVNKQIRAIRLVGKMSLKDAHAITMYCGGMRTVTLASGVSDKVAERICRDLTDVGLKASVVKCDDRVPMILSPNVANVYRWSLRVIVKSAV